MQPLTETAAELTPAHVVAALLTPQLVLVAIALIVAQVLASIARLKVGPVVAADRRASTRRAIVMTALILGVAAWVLLDRGVWPVPVILCLGSALLLVWTTPSSSTAVLGLGGVQRGFHARRFESLEEWRLTGEHLRFRLYGEWTSVPCPASHQAELRAKLVELAPERESPFQD